MNQPQNEVFNQLLLAINMDYPWVLNPKKLNWDKEDTIQLVEFLKKEKIFDSFNYSIVSADHIKNNRRFTIGFETAKVVKYVPYLPEIIYYFCETFNSYLTDKADEPKQITPKTRPALP